MNKNSDYYVKKGNLNYKERSLLDALKKTIKERPELFNDVIPANDFNELKNLHDRITIPDVEATEIETSNIQSMESKPFIDPLNREEPNVRDYVMDDKFDPFSDFQKSNKSAFSEPQDYDQAFEFPTDEELRSSTQTQQTQKQNNRPVNNPSNNNNNNQQNDNAKEKRKSKRFAKTIVELVCGLMEVGFVWYATKDTNPNKLMEYELNNEMDLDTLIDLPSGVEATIKDYFIQQIGDITEASKISEERREQLVDDLTEVFIEKNIQPNATTNMVISGLTVLTEQGVKLYQIVATNNELLNQLRERKMNGVESQPSTYQNQQTTYQEPTNYQESSSSSKRPSRKQKNDITESEMDEMDISVNELSLLTQVPTKE